MSDSEEETNGVSADDQANDDVGGDIIDDFSDLSEDDDRQFDMEEAEEILASYEREGQI